MFEIENLWVKYDSSPIWALQDVTIKASSNQLIVVAGSSGCGKSTLAKTILRLIPLFERAETKGYIRIDGKDIAVLDRKAMVQTIGYVPQYPADFTTSLLVEEEIAFPLENIGFTRENMKQRIYYVLKQLDIAHLRTRLITELSSGELQKVALATALAPLPPLLILDEPMARIDSRTEIILAMILKDLARKGHLVIAFEHRLEYLLPEADHVILLEKGKIIAEGNPGQVLEQLVDVDLPEVAGIDSLKRRPLDLNDARELILELVSTNTSSN
ncbi:MAG: energy-coupling factor ABC transporter ATP-binding protein [Candidatus Odinarchaeota archaeon]